MNCAERDAEKWEGATESRATIAPGRGPSHSRSTATDHDCRRFPVESRKSIVDTITLAPLALIRNFARRNIHRGAASRRDIDTRYPIGRATSPLSSAFFGRRENLSPPEAKAHLMGS